MAMRYLVRRSNAEDLQELKRDIPDLEKRLGKVGSDYGTAGAHYQRDIEVRISPDRYLTYQLMAKKNGADFSWVCPSIELVADDEKGLFALCDRVKTPRPSHLS